MKSFLVWILGWALLTLSGLGALSIGILVLPFAILTLVLAARRNAPWPVPVSALPMGIGAMLLWVGMTNVGSNPCPMVDGGYRGVDTLRPGERSSCGGRDPTWWLVIGGSLVAIGASGYVLSRRGQKPANASASI
jgi:hypothetical protein